MAEHKGGRLQIRKPQISEHSIITDVAVKGAVGKAFLVRKPQFVYESSLNIADLPASIAVVPVLGTLLPLAWVFDAEIIVDECDRDFAESIVEIKKGYIDMYPMMQLKGKITINKIVDNTPVSDEGKDRPICMFSGGVDAVSMTLKHADERPYLLTIWGADFSVNNTKAWDTCSVRNEAFSRELNTEFISAKFNLRAIMDFPALNVVVADSKDFWWHGFQHGLAILCTAAPVVWAKGAERVHIASSFTEESKGHVTCASDPSIDNHVHFCKAHVVHDEYDVSRMGKLQNIAKWCRKNNRKVYLRACNGKPSTGSNCCNCEKCHRTILGLYAIGEDPTNYGFEYEDFGKVIADIHDNAHKMLYHFNTRYIPIINIMRQTYTRDQVREDLLWLYDFNIPADHEIFDWIVNSRAEYVKARDAQKVAVQKMPAWTLFKLLVKKILGLS